MDSEKLMELAKHELDKVKHLSSSAEAIKGVGYALLAIAAPVKEASPTKKE